MNNPKIHLSVGNKNITIWSKCYIIGLAKSCFILSNHIILSKNLWRTLTLRGAFLYNSKSPCHNPHISIRTNLYLVNLRIWHCKGQINRSIIYIGEQISPNAPHDWINLPSSIIFLNTGHTTLQSPHMVILVDIHTRAIDPFNIFRDLWPFRIDLIHCH